MLTEKSYVRVVVFIPQTNTGGVDPIDNGLSNHGASFHGNRRSRFGDVCLDEIEGIDQCDEASARRERKCDAVPGNQHQIPIFIVDFPSTLLHKVHDEAAEDSCSPTPVRESEEKRNSNFKRQDTLLLKIFQRQDIQEGRHEMLHNGRKNQGNCSQLVFKQRKKLGFL